MEIQARVALSLPNTFYKLTLKYDTFQKATYDSYIIASLVANAKKEKQAYEYIDEITGKGSLNLHFKKLYENISKLTKEQINGILVNSLFPITVVNQKYHFKYYPMFNATRMENKVYKGNLINNQELVKTLIMPKGDDIKFLSLEYNQEEGQLKTDNYNAVFSNNGIKVDLDDGNYYPISKEDFSKVYKNDIETLEGYLGNVAETISEGNWNVLSKAIIDSLSRNQYQFRDSNERHCVLTNDFIKTIEIIKVFDLYFYKESKYQFFKENKDLCEDAVSYLMKSKNINEYKTKSLIYLLCSVDEKTTQQVIQYVLGRKDSKELSELGLKLIKSGLEKGWDRDVLVSIKKQVPTSEYKFLYRINDDLDFKVEDLLEIDNADLNSKDKKRKEKHLSEMDNMLKQINLWIGEITNSGIRENIKNLNKSDLKDRVKKFVDKRTGHNKLDYASMNMERLTKEYNEIKDFYGGDFRKIQKELSKIKEDK